eukprot:CAMPEP_0205946996 /NCGR_PEP_ID=MMETSP1325-20131115/69337_1 /ASSEMBLY_ACC=CAM_ASM_000708 /TAXON_ID=236786 /ORGANISM="Florenciella sp., Strain RCC1007" /LENGTH=151 /DNA_ID=CAMNT_0053318093 /DNA_START=461 /DNA_END=916 /DNA_ORIENTATION=-
MSGAGDDDGKAEAGIEGDHDREGEDGNGMDVGIEGFRGALGSADGRSGVGYELYGVVNHLGTMSAGHYVSSIRTRSDGKWHIFNDNILSETSEKDLVNDTAYILWYVRKDMASVNIEDVYPRSAASSSGGMTEEDVEKFMKRRDSGRCAVS